MLIVSQNEDKIINFEQMASLYVDTWSNEEFATEPNCFCIKAEKASDNLICMFLGYYATEERAKEVLKQIIEQYELSERLKEGRGISLGNCNNYVYKMSKE